MHSASNANTLQKIRIKKSRQLFPHFEFLSLNLSLSLYLLYAISNRYERIKMRFLIYKFHIIIFDD